MTTATGGGNAIIDGNGQTLTNAGDVIKGTGTIGTNGSLAVINSGTIDANSSAGSKTLILTGGEITNANGATGGLLEATSGGTLLINNITVNNAGGKITANGGIVQLKSATIQGGTLNALGGGTMETTPGTTATLDGTTHGALTISAGSTYTASNTGVTDILGAIVDKGRIQVNGGSGTNGELNLTGAATLSGGGVVSMTTASGSGSAIVDGNGETLTNGDVIEGTGTIGTNGHLAVTSSGTIDANISAGTLTLSGTDATTNTGVFEATNGGHLDVAGALGGAGKLEIGASSEVELGGATSENSTFLSASAAKLRIDNATTTSYGGVLDSFAKGDILELGNTNATSATPTLDGANTTLTVDLSGGGKLLYTLEGNLTADAFSVTHVNGGVDSDIEIATTAATSAFELAYSLLSNDALSSFVDTRGVFGASSNVDARSAQLNLAATTVHAHS
jgi:fibronectin-binding autotransporter adhesin